MKIMDTRRMNPQPGHKVFLTVSNYWLPATLKNDTHIAIRIDLNINDTSIPVLIDSSLKADFLALVRTAFPCTASYCHSV